MIERKQPGIAVVGSGSIGTLRSRLASEHPAVRFLAVSDTVEANAQKLAKLVGAGVASTDIRAIIAHPEVTAVIVSTSEGEHLDAVLAAMKAQRFCLLVDQLPHTSTHQVANKNSM